jgi:hypothetical protein
MEKHPIDQIFRDKLVDFEKNPPVGLLNQIQQQVAYRGKVRRMNQVRTVLSIAAALVLILMAGWYTSTTDQYAGRNIPMMTQPQESNPKSTTENELLVAPAPTNQQLADLQKEPLVATVKKGKQSIAASLASVPKESPVVKEGKEPLANQATAEVVPAPANEIGQSAALKEERNPDTVSKTTKRAAELPYLIRIPVKMVLPRDPGASKQNYLLCLLHKIKPIHPVKQ